MALLGTRADVEALHRRCVNGVAAMKPWFAATCPAVLTCIILQLLFLLHGQNFVIFRQGRLCALDDEGLVVW